jgi:hypothetical protein
MSILAEFVEYDNRVLCVEFGFFLKLLHSCNDFSRISLHFELIILFDIQKHTELVLNYIIWSPPMA